MPAKIAFVWSFWRTICRTTRRRGRRPVSSAMHHLTWWADWVEAWMVIVPVAGSISATMPRVSIGWLEWRGWGGGFPATPAAGGGGGAAAPPPPPAPRGVVGFL